MTRTVTLQAQGRGTLSFCGCVAQTRILSNTSLGVFDACPEHVADAKFAGVDVAAAVATTTRGFIAGALRDIVITGDARCLRIDFVGLGRLDIDLHTQQSRSSGFASPAAEAEALLGPGLLLPLAQLGCFALHGSAIRVAAGAIALLAPSGSGKSTMTQYAGAVAAQVLADDVLPIECEDTPQLLPRFPQLKWATPLALADSREALVAVVFIERGAATLGLRRIAAQRALPLLIRDSVAARLYGRDLLAAHLRTMSALATQVPMYTLDWPECAPQQLPQQARRALELLAALS
jgi:hypothetical protein